MDGRFNWIRETKGKFKQCGLENMRSTSQNKQSVQNLLLQLTTSSAMHYNVFFSLYMYGLASLALNLRNILYLGFCCLDMYFVNFFGIDCGFKVRRIKGVDWINPLKGLIHVMRLKLHQRIRKVTFTKECSLFILSKRLSSYW